MGLIYRRSHVLQIRNAEGSFTPIITLDGQKTFDSVLSEESENAPQTKVIAAQFKDISEKLESIESAIGNIGSGGAGNVPTASAEVLGGVKIGDGIDVDTDGTISLNQEKVVTIMEENTTEFTESEIKKLFDDLDKEEPTTV